MKITIKTGYYLSLIIICWTISNVAYAHKVKLFATVEGSTINGYAYFSGGAAVQNMPVIVKDNSGVVLGESLTDTQGRFSYVLTQKQAVQLSINTGDGHQASYAIQADDVSITTENKATKQNVKTNLVEQPIQLLVEQAVYQQVRPLREQLEKYEEKVRLHDILGGIGYIVGIAGLWFFLQGRRVKKE
ncbi:hypothetical protein [Beggiatoa leptomitoformis]|uniref:Cobalt ABC transporter permease n=1 Tax=Beggiatoa leptomitoformis TaxID=288004 RepID=A0A2N9YJ41_9GAMM|nr:hypothetical protein [Beggiatoa leptomitoformis]ALG69286.2 hypothetical protein AL038_02105 [Beggiatoa leptomitoformis]AUI70520.2 hypothetical protein BLE401_03935 [Beggiatoa leptomitoformis]